MVGTNRDRKSETSVDLGQESGPANHSFTMELLKGCNFKTP